MVEHDRHYYEVKDTKLGDFACKLDSQYMHRDDGAGGAASAIGETLRDLMGDIGSIVIPCEIVCPPIAYDELEQLEELTSRLAQAGAAATGDSLFYAFGTQLNPEIAELRADYVLSILKAQVLLSDWLRAIMEIDVTRQLSAFATQFPRGYAMRIADPAYWPDMEQLIDDYLQFNPTRNRELDLLPLFAWIDAGRVARRVKDSRIKQRPTFHYRLPDARIGQPDWSLALEWNRWCAVERLAADRERLAEMGEDFVTRRQELSATQWAVRASEWLIV
ncbi:MAG: hypothetical protein RLZ98_2271 [Pseudomonadota bacterium]